MYVPIRIPLLIPHWYRGCIPYWYHLCNLKHRICFDRPLLMWLSWVILPHSLHYPNTNIIHSITQLSHCTSESQRFDIFTETPHRRDKAELLSLHIWSVYLPTINAIFSYRTNYMPALFYCRRYHLVGTGSRRYDAGNDEFRVFRLIMRAMQYDGNMPVILLGSR